MSTSPLSSTFKPMPHDASNTHPYAIKSSSSGLLSRSNSMSNPVLSHHYVPLPLAKVTGKKRRYVPSKKLSKNELDDVDERLTLDQDPDAVSAPPVSVSVRVRRRDSLPANFSESNKTEFEDGLKDLPSDPFKANPKQWTPFQLAAYLSSTLRLPGGDVVPAPVMRKIAAFILTHHLNGRAFLKMTRDDYNAYDIDPLWKESLIIANVTLRQSLVQGQIFGSIKAASISDEDLFLLRNPDEEDTPIRSPTTPGAYIPWNKKRTLGRLEAGRVKGIAYKYERSHSAGESDYDPSERRLGGFLEKEGDSDSDVSFVESPSLENSVSHHAMHESESPLQEAGSSPEEATVQELIQAQSSSSRSWGAKAWEEENSTNVTAKKITQEQGNAEEVLTERTDKYTNSHPKTLASLFSGPEIDIPRTEILERTAQISEPNKAPEDVRTSSEVPPPSDADALLTSTSSVDSQESLSTSLWCKSESPSTSPGSSLIITEDYHRAAKAPRTDLFKEDESFESLREALRIVRERLVVVEERLFDLEQREDEQKHGAHKSHVEERTVAEVKVKPNISSPGRSHPSAAVARVREHDVVNEHLDRPKSRNNYALSDMTLYSYMFYASVGLAALVLDRTVFGRRKY